MFAYFLSFLLFGVKQRSLTDNSISSDAKVLGCFFFFLVFGGDFFTISAYQKIRIMCGHGGELSRCCLEPGGVKLTHKSLNARVNTSLSALQEQPIWLSFLRFSVSVVFFFLFFFLSRPHTLIFGRVQINIQ